MAPSASAAASSSASNNNTINHTNDDSISLHSLPTTPNITATAMDDDPSLTSYDPPAPGAGSTLNSNTPYIRNLRGQSPGPGPGPGATNRGQRGRYDSAPTTASTIQGQAQGQGQRRSVLVKPSKSNASLRGLANANAQQASKGKAREEVDLLGDLDGGGGGGGSGSGSAGGGGGWDSPTSQTPPSGSPRLVGDNLPNTTTTSSTTPPLKNRTISTASMPNRRSTGSTIRSISGATAADGSIRRRSALLSAGGGGGGGNNSSSMVAASSRRRMAGSGGIGGQGEIDGEYDDGWEGKNDGDGHDHDHEDEGGGSGSDDEDGERQGLLGKGGEGKKGKKKSSSASGKGKRKSLLSTGSKGEPTGPRKFRTILFQSANSLRSLSLSSSFANSSSSLSSARKKQQKRFPPNIVKNSKYNVFTFLPLVLYEQFKFFFNLYFLLVAISQIVPALRIGFLITYVLPLVFVLFVTLSKEAFDDWTRHKRDRLANSTLYTILDFNSSPLMPDTTDGRNNDSRGKKGNTKGRISYDEDVDVRRKSRSSKPNTNADPSDLESGNGTTTRSRPSSSTSLELQALPPIKYVPSSKLKVGDLVILEKNDRVPSDMVLLRTSDPGGSCFVRTDQLDGETDWKLRVAIDGTQRLGAGNPTGGGGGNGSGFSGTGVSGGIGGGTGAKGEIELLGIEAEVEVEEPRKDIHNFVGTFKMRNLTRAMKMMSPPMSTTPGKNDLTPHFTIDDDEESDEEVGSTSPTTATTTKQDGSAPVIIPMPDPSSSSPSNDELVSYPLTAENVLWANTVLAAGAAIGMVIYTGKETRAVMNTSHPKTKMGLLEFEINTLAKILCAVTFALSLLLVALNGFRGLWYVYIFRFIIIFSTIIPISLRVNLDFGKTFYARQIERDPEIPGTIVRTSTLPEELGRIEYLLSDKTGTLTQNEMELKKLHMGTMSYGLDSMDEVSLQLSIAFGEPQSGGGPNNQIHGRSQSLVTGTMLAGRGRRDMSSRVKDVVLALALCHNVTPVSNDDGSVTYQASSPDEVAIVRFTESVGLTLINRDRTSMSLQSSSSGQIFDFDILEVFPFTSESKRMGIIIKERQSGEITFYQKGADVVMAKIVQYNDWLEEECDNMAREGLRTLVMGRKRLTSEAWSHFKTSYQQASVSLEDRNEAMGNVIRELLEKDLELLGVTGVEDKLQDDVKMTLELLRNAGIKVWMLTGDKIETATCIAISSKLVARGQYIHQIAKLNSTDAARDELEFLQTKLDCCLVIDGESLHLCLQHFQNEFISLATSLSAVVACRCSPTQKADIARLIRHHTKKRVCCIGDGGNDVSMIQAADVGLGIVGKEGKQASLAADFSINQFSYLTKLMVWHGRNSYKRSAKLAQFIIHRGLIISVIQCTFSMIFYFSPIAIYQGWLMICFPTVYTMLPVFSLVMDRDINEDLALLYPELYKELTKGRSLSQKTFFQWTMISVYQGGAIMILSLLLFETDFINIVAISFTALIVNELIMVALEVTTWHYYMVISEVVSIVLYVVSMALLPEYFDLSFVLTVPFVWKVAVIVAVSALPLWIIKLLKAKLAPTSYAKLREY